MPKTLVIVESPAKARTIGKFLGDGYVVESSIGHVRDLPQRAADVPAKFKKEKWAKLGVDVDNDFKPLYVVNPDKKSHIKKLKDLLADTDELLLATDEDREGESIAWHLVEVLKPKVPYRRMVFHEITQAAIQRAIESPREIDRNLVDAQEARRILDRLYGYEVSPVLWKKIMPRLSAGRVQSVATRIVVERERARIRFQKASYWDLTASFEARPPFEARLVSVDGKKLAMGKDFSEKGEVKGDLVVLKEAAAHELARGLKQAPFEVIKTETKPYRRQPTAPFMTSTLQQEVGRKLRFSASRTMRAAQRLYEGGFITYMRTDSTTLSTAAIEASRAQIRKLYGDEYLPKAPRSYAKKVKNAQEAHEAIRPSGETFRTPAAVAKLVEPDLAKVYELIWKRTIASQMEDARGERVAAKLQAKSPTGQVAEFAASGLSITFPGFLRAYVEGSDNPSQELEDKERHLPKLEEGQTLEAASVEPDAHETQPPPRFTEASLVKRLEELGVGRPSTYASILSTIQDRGYVWRKASALVPTFKAMAVVTLLEQHFGHLVDYAFTARMENELDEIASGREQTVPYLRRFYFGQPENDNASPEASSEPGTASPEGLRDLVQEQLALIDARAINTLPVGVDSQGDEMVVRVGRYGPYLQRGDETVSLPGDMAPDELDQEKAEELLNAPSGDRELGADPETGLPVFVKNGQFGAYVQLGDPAALGEKPKTSSLFKAMTPDTVTLEEALRLLSLPRSLGEHEGTEVLAANGRYGPYLSKGSDTRSLETEEQLFTVTLEEAVALFDKPKERRRRGQAAASGPLRELGDDPVSGKRITLRKGKFGPYVTDGETNASLRTGDDPDTITPERAQELIQLRRDRGPSAGKAKKATKKRPSKKAAAKTAKRGSGSGTKKKPAKKAKKASSKKAKSARKGRD